jgi:hypothetical protein
VTLTLFIQVFQHVSLEWLDRSEYFLIRRRYISSELDISYNVLAVMALPVVYPDDFLALYRQSSIPTTSWLCIASRLSRRLPGSVSLAAILAASYTSIRMSHAIMASHAVMALTVRHLSECSMPPWHLPSSIPTTIVYSDDLALYPSPLTCSESAVTRTTLDLLSFAAIIAACWTFNLTSSAVMVFTVVLARTWPFPFRIQ